MKLTEFNLALSNGKAVDIILHFEFNGKTVEIVNVQIEGKDAREMQLPTSVSIKQNGNGELAFSKYSVQSESECYYSNNTITKEIIEAIMRKKDEITF